MPLLSILMPVYNAGRYLRPAVASVLLQDFEDFELIAINDGSTDGSKRILDSFAELDDRVRVFSRPNAGIVRALNAGLEAAQGELIARMEVNVSAATMQSNAANPPRNFVRSVKLFISRLFPFLRPPWPYYLLFLWLIGRFRKNIRPI